MKKLYFMYFLIFFFSFPSIKGEAQVLSTFIDEKELEFKVKQIDEFFKRFNYETDYKGEEISLKSDSTQSDSILKRKNIMTLLNIDKFMNKNHKLDSISTELIDYIIENKEKIHYTDTNWYAEITISAIFQDKKYPLTLKLKTECRKEHAYKWSIYDVKSPIFNCINKPSQDSIFIFPGVHGTAFMTLPSFINLNHKSIKNLFFEKYQTNYLSIFGYLIATGELKLQTVTNVRYHFHLGKYRFTVEKIEKNKSYNKGWLINNIEKEQ